MEVSDAMVVYAGVFYNMKDFSEQYARKHSRFRRSVASRSELSGRRVEAGEYEEGAVSKKWTIIRVRVRRYQLRLRVTKK